MAYKFQIGTFKTAGQIDVSEGDIELNSDVVDNDDLAGNITSDKMAKFEDGEVVFGGEADAFVSSETAKFNMDTEIAARGAADTTLQGNIDTEAGLREAGDATVQAAVDAEVIRATAAEGVLQGNIDTEEAARIAADNTATTDRGLIRSEFDSADTALSGALNDRIDAEAARIDAILSGSGLDMDQLVEIVAAYELAY